MSNSRTPPTTRPQGVHYDGDLRSALVAAAAAAIAESGPEGVSLRDVARRLGVSHAAPAHHFVDKTGLLTAVATRGFGLFLDHLGRVVAAGPQDPVTLMVTLGQAYIEFSEHHAGYFSLMFQHSLINIEDPDYVAASNAAFQALLGTVMECQRRMWRSNADARALALASWSLAHGLSVLRNQGALLRHFPDPAGDPIEAIARALL